MNVLKVYLSAKSWFLKHKQRYTVYTATGVCCVSLLTVCWTGWNGTKIPQHVTVAVCICSVLPDDGLQICPKHVEVDWRNKLRVNSWFLVTQTYRDAARSTEHKTHI